MNQIEPFIVEEYIHYNSAEDGTESFHFFKASKVSQNLISVLFDILQEAIIEYLNEIY